MMGNFDTGSSRLLFYFTLNAGVSLAVETEENGEISKCSEIITKILWGQLCFGLNRHCPSSCPRVWNNQLPSLRTKSLLTSGIYSTGNWSLLGKNWNLIVTTVWRH